MPIVGEFYDVLLKYWRFKLMPAAESATPPDDPELIEIPDGEDEDQEEDLSEFFEIVKDEEGGELKALEDPYEAMEVTVPDGAITAVALPAAESTPKARELVAEMPDISPAAPQAKPPVKDMPENAKKACVFDAGKLDHDQTLSDEDLDKKIALLTSLLKIYFPFSLVCGNIISQKEFSNPTLASLTFLCPTCEADDC